MLKSVFKECEMVWFDTITVKLKESVLLNLKAFWFRGGHSRNSFSAAWVLLCSMVIGSTNMLTGRHKHHMLFANTTELNKGACPTVLLWEMQFKKLLNSSAVGNWSWEERYVNDGCLWFSEQIISTAGKDLPLIFNSRYWVEVWILMATWLPNYW